MGFIWKLGVAILANGAGLYIATRLIDGFVVSTEPQNLILAAIVLTAINFLIKPLLKLILTPIIILTLGLAILGINAFMLYVMTQLMPGIVSVTGLIPLLYATILTSLINVVIRKIL